MTTTTWLRVTGDRLIRTDLITGFDLWGPPVHGGGRSEAVAGQPARIMALMGMKLDKAAEVANVDQAERGGELLTSLASRLAAANARGTNVRYVYGLYSGEELKGWSDGPVIPVSDPRVMPLHMVPDPAPGRWLFLSSRHQAPGHVASSDISTS
ncbi:hypothetical protein [Streptomyces sp. NPDC015125]|uniref:hypothetical protein n=1 Tax=Streptomyces sp. NPDC015125 TaxID=3364938 RepID=UPI00370181C7